MFDAGWNSTRITVCGVTLEMSLVVYISSSAHHKRLDFRIHTVSFPTEVNIVLEISKFV